ncbi:MAG TPA: GGDEF domain-containing protein [Tianweitania sediminis]|nr:GGDEF domain-containing protein [Tianweitania sediminis]
MRELHISPVPRNYELIYEAYVGTNHALGAELLALGDKPTQDELDSLSERHLLAASGVAAVEQARDKIAREAEDIMLLLSREKLSLEKYGRILDKTQDGLRSTQALTQDILQKIVGIITNATASTIDQGQQTFASMLDKSAELEKVKSSLEEYKRLADTDALTQLFNRRAFDTALARLFGSPSLRSNAALLLADIDRFKEVNDRFGHPVGDQILQIVAGILRAHGGQRAMVSRTGGEEFALLLDKTTTEAAAAFAEQIRRSIEETPFVNKANASSYGRITISIGLCMGSQAEGAADLYSKADRALYMSKVKGRNRVSVYGEQAEVRESVPGKSWLLYRKD